MLTVDGGDTGLAIRMNFDHSDTDASVARRLPRLRSLRSYVLIITVQGAGDAAFWSTLK